MKFNIHLLETLTFLAPLMLSMSFLMPLVAQNKNTNRAFPMSLNVLPIVLPNGPKSPLWFKNILNIKQFQP